MIQSGQWRFYYRFPDPRRWRLALLKHAYLAACLYLRTVPDSEDARAIRRDLIAARDTPKNARPPDSDAADRLNFFRSPQGKQGPPLALMARDRSDEGLDPEVLISLAGVLFVSWPFLDVAPGHREQGGGGSAG